MLRISASAHRALRPLAHGVLIGALLTGLVAGTALAGGKGKPGGGNTGTSGLAVVMVQDNNANGAPNWSDRITFTFSTTNPYPQINTTCTQGGTLVYSSAHLMYWPNYWEDPGIFSLQSGAWSGGAADCTAVLKGTSSKGTLVTLGTLAFSVAA